jgi:hypothetical protein
MIWGGGGCGRVKQHRISETWLIQARTIQKMHKILGTRNMDFAVAPNPLS